MEQQDVKTLKAPARGSQSRRGALLMGCVALLPLVVLAGLAVLSALGAYRASDEARLRDTARALAAAVDAQLGTYLVALQALATSRELEEDFDAQAFTTRSRGVGELFDGWIVLLGPPPGYRVLSLSKQEDHTPLPTELPPNNRRAIEPLLAEVFEHGRAGISDLFEGSVIRRQILTAMVPVVRDGLPPRALALSFEPAALRQLLARQDLPPGTFAAVADGQLHILAHSFDPEGQRIGVRAPGWVNAAIAGKQRALVTGPGWSGEDNIYAVERLRLAPGWTVTVAEPLAAQQASAWQALRWLIAGGTALGLGLAVVVWASRREAVHDARREAEALRTGRAEVERLLGGLPAVIFLREVAPDGSSRPVYRGGDLDIVMGWPAADLATRRNFEDLIHPEDTNLAREMPQLLREGYASYEWRMRQPGGGWRTLHTLARVLVRRHDGGAEIVGYTVDVSARREAEARAKASARLASLGEMAAGLAHEIKQPLQTISLAAEIAQLEARQGNAQSVDESLERIVEQAGRTADMIDRLRRFARGGEDGVPPQAVPLAAAVQGALDLTRSALRDASIEVEVALGEPTPIVQGQSVLIEQVLSNLLLNARDALTTRHASAPRRIRIAVAPGANGIVRLTVADTGGGIAPEVMARLFEPFVTTKGPDKGTGLGLSICHGLMKGMGGSIEAHNEAEGAVFTITLKAA
ncbi:sensor histidine kinase [Falsiroseomonas ponticola]|uniref:sensor histidine kinase n=1 Tax=Falsiroseomonas ponticola TaxID=2786951 RepID=UPI00193272FE|nr:ATP-binding protein [Roseomonas ponticola]